MGLASRSGRKQTTVKTEHPGTSYARNQAPARKIMKFAPYSAIIGLKRGQNEVLGNFLGYYALVFFGDFAYYDQATYYDLFLANI